MNIGSNSNNEESNASSSTIDKSKAAKTIISSDVIEDIPVELSNNLTLIARKLTAFLSYYSAANLSRLSTLTKFITEAEDRMYNIDVMKLDMKELNSRYKEAKRAQAEIMTIARQVSQQACETDNTARVDETYNLLKSMSVETLMQLQSILVESDNEDSEE